MSAKVLDEVCDMLDTYGGRDKVNSSYTTKKIINKQSCLIIYIECSYFFLLFQIRLFEV